MFIDNNQGRQLIRKAIRHSQSDTTKFISHIAFIDWGVSIQIMSIGGCSFCNIYWYHDDEQEIYLSDLHVDENFRQQGNANAILHIFENIAKELSMPTLILKVLQNSWMQSWYERKGYKILEDQQIEDGYVWLSKTIS